MNNQDTEYIYQLSQLFIFHYRQVLHMIFYLNQLSYMTHILHTNH